MQPKKGINQGMMALCVYGDMKIIDTSHLLQKLVSAETPNGTLYKGLSSQTA